MEPLRQTVLRFHIYGLHIPVHRVSRAAKRASRSLRAALGLRPGQPSAPSGPALPSVPWNRLCRASGTVFRELEKAHGNVTLAELAVLNALCRTFQPQRIFEIGTFDGRTTLNLALNSEAEIWTLDLPQGVETVHPIDERDTKFVRKPSSGARFSTPPNSSLPCVQRITQLYGDSASFDFSPWHETIDLVFIDGSHSYDYVINDTQVALRLLRSESGILVWHDYGGSWTGVTQALHELRQKLPGLPLVHVRGTSLVVSIRHGDQPSDIPQA